MVFSPMHGALLWTQQQRMPPEDDENIVAYKIHTVRALGECAQGQLLLLKTPGAVAAGEPWKGVWYR